MLHVASGKHNQADHDQPSQGANPFGLRRSRASHTAYYGVEVRIDDGDWHAATISRPISSATWVQWTMSWTATQGSHTIEVRAIDGSGTVQTAQMTPPAPDGARGHHRITVQVG